jgi:hypothetical protein
MHIRRDLKERGLVTGREVVIRRGGDGGAPGQRTDLYVSVSGNGAPISAIIEVKGSWHQEVLTAMETKLAGAYLHQNPECRYGLYLVELSLCDRWKDEVRKRRTAKLGSREDLSARLAAQATDLSEGLSRVVDRASPRESPSA